MPNRYIVIPSRYGSSRLPGKPLLDIAGKPMVQHVYEAARKAQADDIVIATDDERIVSACESFGAKVVMTRAEHESGTDRIAEVADQCGWQDDDIVINVQGDEPLMPAAAIAQVGDNLERVRAADMATLCAPIDDAEAILNPNVVKVVYDQNGLALYFSRAPIPWNRDTASGAKALAMKHIGIYAYRVGKLKAITAEPVCALEDAEKLEQLRAMWMGLRIHVEPACDKPGPGVDTAEDLALMQKLLGQLGQQS